MTDPDRPASDCCPDCCSAERSVRLEVQTFGKHGGYQAGYGIATCDNRWHGPAMPDCARCGRPFVEHDERTTCPPEREGDGGAAEGALSPLFAGRLDGDEVRLIWSGGAYGEWRWMQASLAVQPRANP